MDSRLLDLIHRSLDKAGLRAAPGALGQVRATIDRALDGGGAYATASDTLDRPSRAVPAGAGSLPYRLHVPRGYTGQPMPLVVMLHGCKQNPADFEVGTGMDGVADERGFLVAYPEQSARANGSNCWNWFEPAQQARDGREPAALARMVREIGATHAVDPRRVFVAGLSAGAAMAVILGQTYPEVFAGVAAHSGLPYGAATDVPSAFAAMKGQAMPARRRPAQAGVPTLVLHGDADATVEHGNGAAIVRDAVAAYRRAGTELTLVMAPTATIGGRRCTTSHWVDENGRTRVEQWVIASAGHAWSGGDPKGSFTDARGPRASAEIARFFLSL